MSAELVRRKLLGCRTVPIKSGDLYFLLCDGEYDVFLDPQTQEVRLVYLDGIELNMGSITGAICSAKSLTYYSTAWEKTCAALREYLKCQQN